MCNKAQRRKCIKIKDPTNDSVLRLLWQNEHEQLHLEQQAIAGLALND